MTIEPNNFLYICQNVQVQKKKISFVPKIIRVDQNSKKELTN